MRTIGWIAIGLTLCGESSAQTEKLQANLTRVRQPVSLMDGKLAGPGGETLRLAVRDARYVFIGEDHGLAEIPAFSAAVIDEFSTRGFRNLVLEVGPTSAQYLQRMVNAGNPDAELSAYDHRYPFSLAFYNMRQEFDLLKHARRAAGPGLRIIGVDQELMGASKLILDTVLGNHRNDPAGATIRGLLAQESQSYQEALDGNPMKLFMMTAKTQDIEALRNQLSAAHDAKNKALIDSMMASRRIYELLSSSQYDSNTTRAMLMKRSLNVQIAKDANGAPERAIFKFGANHAMKGLNAVNSRELGNYVAEMADSAGESSVHILIVAAKGNQLRFGGIGKPMVTAPVDLVGPGQSDFPFAKPVFERALQDSGEWSLFDFRALRNFADREPGLDPQLVRLIFGFDLAVVIPQGTPSSQIQ